MRTALSIGLFTTLVLLVVASFGVATVRRRPTRVYQIPGKLPPALLEQVLRARGPYEHHS